MSEAGRNWTRLLHNAIQTNLAIKKLKEDIQLLNTRVFQLEQELAQFCISCPTCNTTYHLLFEYCPVCYPKEE